MEVHLPEKAAERGYAAGTAMDSAIVVGSGAVSPQAHAFDVKRDGFRNQTAVSSRVLPVVTQPGRSGT
jgi:hypothetical protein